MAACVSRSARRPAACCSGFFLAQFPLLLRTQDGGLTYRDLAAPDSVLRGLLWAVGIGLAIIAPSLGYLIRTYKMAPDGK